MITREAILQKLPVYSGRVNVLTENQSVNDIIEGVKKCHHLYANDYNLIAPFFVGSTVYQTCKNLFYFLRRSTFYFVETEKSQTLRSPSAILSTGLTIGIDCKNYALFIGGVLDAINRLGLQKINYVYRFASDKLFDKTPNHVFIVVNPGSDNEIVIDPIPQSNFFNEHLIYTYFVDKKIKSMSLEILSGRNNAIGSNDVFDVVASGADVALPGAGAVVRIFQNFFGSRPNPNDWIGWDEQDRQNGQFPSSSVRGYVLNDGDSVPNEAVNIASYIAANGLKNLIASGNPVTIPGKGWRDVTVQEIATKLRRGGLAEQANALLQERNIVRTTLNAGSSPLFANNGSGVTQQASTNSLLTWALVGGALFLVFKK